MKRINELGSFAIVAGILLLTACNKSPNQPAAVESSTAQPSTAQPAASDVSTTPASGNLAVAVQTTAQAAPANQADSSEYADNSDFDTNEQPVYASQPPPPLPEYSQPECPAQDEIWTPGYWNYASSGYYWVPGAWVLAPYVGALWTPPYWAYASGRYLLHHGYWAPHIGFYGGINYGFGYVGRGYYGGYWRDGVFNYNRSVTNVHVDLVRNVYTYRVESNNTRISYNGGNGGVQQRPIAAEIAVLHETRTAPVNAQIQHMREAAKGRAQFAQANHGRPAMLTETRPLPTEYRAPSPRPAAEERRAAVPNRANTPNPMTRPEARPAPEARQPQTMERANEHPAPNPAANHNEHGAAALPHPAERRNEHPEARPAAAPPRVEASPAPHQPRAESRPAAPEPRIESHPAPPPRAESHPATQPRVDSHREPAPRVEARPVPQPRVEARPAPPPRVEAHPAPEARSNPNVKKAPPEDTRRHPPL